MGDPRRIKQKQPDYKSRPIKTEGWKSEEHFNSYVDNIINSKGFQSHPKAEELEAKIRMFAEAGAFRSIEQLIFKDKYLDEYSDAMITFKRMGAGDGPNGMWVQKGMSVLNEDGSYSKLKPGEVKTLTRLQTEYNQEGDPSKANFYRYSPTQYGGTRVINPFGKYTGGVNHVSGKGISLQGRQNYLNSLNEATEELSGAAGQAGAAMLGGAAAGNAAANAQRKKNNR
jgi:hypothetical protein